MKNDGLLFRVKVVEPCFTLVIPGLANQCRNFSFYRILPLPLSGKVCSSRGSPVGNARNVYRKRATVDWSLKRLSFTVITEFTSPKDALAFANRTVPRDSCARNANNKL